MKNRKIAVLIDSILTLIIAFFAFFIILSTLKRPAIIKYILSFLFALCLSAIVFIHKRRKYNSLMLSQRELTQLENMLFELELATDEEAMQLLLDLLQALGIDAKITNGRLTYKNTCYLFNFSKELTRAQLCQQVKGEKQKIIFFCNTLSKEAEELAGQIKERVQIINGELLFSLMKKAEINEDYSKILAKRTKIKLKPLLERALTKKRAFRYAVLSATFLLFSKFTFYPTYYKIFSALLIILSAICLIFGKREIKAEPVLIMEEG